MNHYFFDSRGRVKRYIKEVGNQWVTGILEDKSNNRILVARITEAESNSAFARLVREKIWTSAEANLQQKQLKKHFRHEYRVISVTVLVVQQAIEFLHQHPLRAYDAIQLAGAVLTNIRLVQQLKPPLTFVSGDKRLLTVASTIGLKVEDPNAYP